MSPDAPGIDRVAICALTFRRPHGLTRLLTELEALDVDDATSVTIIIVDNDADASARDAVGAHAESSRFNVRYVHEPTRGISSARNAAVRTALEGDADAICFLDDDEWPDRTWLTEFLDTAERTGADVVTGPVFAEFETPPPQWVLDGGFFDRRRHRHEEPIRYATTSTVLIRASALRTRPAPLDTEPFDLAFGLSGGEDTHLFAQMRDAGCTIVWCDHAHVSELIPASKVRTGWMLRREYRRGQTLSLSMRQRTPGAWRATRRITNGGIEIARGIAQTIIGVFRGRGAVVTGLHRIVFGAGMWTGLAGRRYREYATTHGT